jgi:hypothetical protein
MTKNAKNIVQACWDQSGAARFEQENRLIVLLNTADNFNYTKLNTKLNLNEKSCLKIISFCNRTRLNFNGGKSKQWNKRYKVKRKKPSNKKGDMQRKNWLDCRSLIFSPGWEEEIKLSMAKPRKNRLRGCRAVKPDRCSAGQGEGARARDVMAEKMIKQCRKVLLPTGSSRAIRIAPNGKVLCGGTAPNRLAMARMDGFYEGEGEPKTACSPAKSKSEAHQAVAQNDKQEQPAELALNGKNACMKENGPGSADQKKTYHRWKMKNGSEQFRKEYSDQWVKESIVNGTYQIWKLVVGNSKNEPLHPYHLGQNNEGKLIAGEIGRKSKYFKITLRPSLLGRVSPMDSSQLCDDKNISKQDDGTLTRIVKREGKNGSETNSSKDKATRDRTLVWRQPRRQKNSATISDSLDNKMSNFRKIDHEISKRQNGLTNSRAPFFSEQFSIFLAGTFSGWEIGTLAGSFLLKKPIFRPMALGPLKALVNQKNISQTKYCDLLENKRWAVESHKSMVSTHSNSDATRGVFRPIQRIMKHNGRVGKHKLGKLNYRTEMMKLFLRSKPHISHVQLLKVLATF